MNEFSDRRGGVINSTPDEMSLKEKNFQGDSFSRFKTDSNGNRFGEDVSFGEGSDVINSCFEGHNFVGKYSTCAYSKFGKYSYISKCSTIKNTTVGKFTSISWNCTVGPEEHDFHRLTCSSVLTSTKTFKLFNHKFYNPFDKLCAIGNDVWIGANAVILRGVTIPDGCVIGANSIVKTTPPPYSVVVGSPAEVIKLRFSDDVIEKLLEICWWNYDDKVIRQLEPIFHKNNIEMSDIEEISKILNLGKLELRRTEGF